MGLIERIAFHLEGTETTFSRDESGAPTHIEKSWGPERWIRAAASGRMTAIDLLAVIVFQDYLTPGIDAQAVAEGWLAELRRAVEAGEVTPRDYSTLLPCRQEFERLEWVISKADAVAFLERRQSAIDLEATVAHLLGVVLRAGETHYHPGTGEPMQTLWDAGFMPTDGREATPASVEPVEWCGMLPVFRAELPCAERGRQSPPESAQATEAPAHAPSASASPAARPEAVAVPAGAPETPAQRRERLRARANYWRGQGVRDWTERVAGEEGVTVGRIRQILGRAKPEERTGGRKKSRQAATFCSGLMAPSGRTR